MFEPLDLGSQRLGVFRPATRFLTVVAVAFTGVIHGADWQQELTPWPPEAFPPLPPVETTYRFGWEKFFAAEAEFKVATLPNGLVELQGAARSTGVVRKLWRFDLQHSSWRDAMLRPQGFFQSEEFKRKTVKTWVGFERNRVDRRNEITPLDKSSPVMTYPVAKVFDPFSAYLLIRSQPFRPGDHYRVLVYPGLKLYLAEVEVVGVEMVKVEKVPRKAIKLLLSLRRVTDQMTLVPHEKFKRAAVWLSDDQERLPLKAEADIFVGTVWAEIHEVNRPK